MLGVLAVVLGAAMVAVAATVVFVVWRVRRNRGRVATLEGGASHVRGR